MGDFIPYIVKHNTHGLGLCVGFSSDGHCEVKLFFKSDVEEMIINKDSLKRVTLYAGTICETENKTCKILNKVETDDSNEVVEYRVEYDSGLEGVLAEYNLKPIRISKPSNCLEALKNLRHGGFLICKAREKLNRSYYNLLRRGAGVKSLLSSRINLYPHQAFVAATIIRDTKKRYLLADEVGLGKTIEAGIVIHDILATNGEARILVLCPSALVQQWFVELYSKFCGIIFKFPELDRRAIDFNHDYKLILSLNMALQNKDKIIDQHWDMVVVDEVHHLLRSENLYNFINTLSRKSKSLLLLSALPAKQREHEYFKLLCLLEPEKYQSDNPENTRVNISDFSDLYAKQREIGSRIRIINRRLIDFSKNKENAAQRAIDQIKDLTDLPVLKEDSYLRIIFEKLNPKDEYFIKSVHKILYYVSDYYRINRRILRNRREKLIREDKLEKIERNKNIKYYECSIYEDNARRHIQNILNILKNSNLHRDIYFSLTKQLFQSLVDPDSLCKVLALGINSESQIDTDHHNLTELDELVGYSEWEILMRFCWKKAKIHLEDSFFLNAIQVASDWKNDDENIRLNEWITFLRDKNYRNTDSKYILFAGFPGLAAKLSKLFSNQFGDDDVANFYHGLDPNSSINERKIKEEQVTKFMDNPGTWLMVSDETGGEGRNFQFAQELFHYDLPLQATKIEQRIGRLDRLGREKDDVMSNMILSKGTLEDYWYRCLSEGLEIFSSSISGIEFGLRDIEHQVLDSLVNDDDQALINMIPLIRERVIEEREMDESQDQLDIVSFDNETAEALSQVTLTKSKENEISKTFIKYFNMISNRGFRNIYDPNLRNIVEFTPSDIRPDENELNLLNPKKDRRGTFFRDIAQIRPDLELFSVGNDFFDSLCRSLTQDSSNRSYAIYCKLGSDLWDSDPWTGFHFVFNIRSKSKWDEKFSYHNFLEYFFAGYPRPVFISDKQEFLENPSSLIALLGKLKKEDRRNKWLDLTSKNSELIEKFYPDWDEMLQTSYDLAKKNATNYYKSQLDEIISLKCSTLEETKNKLSFSKPDDWESSTNEINSLIEALYDWVIDLDLVGYISINGQIARG